IRPASPVNVFGRILSGPSDFGRVRSGSKVRVERAQGEAGMKPK
ncbi:MAG: hypothetical protein HYY08_00540, partial [Firmicutes bacterium]|nr:hypothetical protein [Bacillota bacterium]